MVIHIHKLSLLMVNRIILILFFFSIFFADSFCQSNNVFRIHFTDKNNSPYSVLQPLDFLSSKAIDRRNRYSIAIDERDLPINEVYFDSILNYPGVELLAKSRWFNCITVAGDSVMLNDILTYSFVKNVDRIKIPEKNIPSNKLNVETQKRFVFDSENYYGAAFDQIEMHRGHLLHNDGFTGEGMTIAVLDAGFPFVNSMPAFSKLFSDNRVLGTYNFVKDTVDVYTNTNGHGSLVLSCMGTELPYEHVGTSPMANYYFFITEDADSEMPIEEDNWVEAAEYADSAGVDLINTSLGYTSFDDATLNYTYADMDGNTTFISRGADVAASKGILVVVSAGNSGTDTWFHIGAPGDADSVMTVGAVGADRLYASYSSKGPSSDGDVKPNIAAQGYLSAVVWPGGNVTLGSGTSFSAPISCGLTACLWQAHPDKNNMQIINAIQVSSSHFSVTDSLTGYGIPDFYLAHQLLSGNAEDHSLFFVENIFPNPFSSEVNIDVFAGSNSEVDIIIFSVSGQLILEKSVALKSEMKNRINITRDFEMVSSGMYFVEIHSGDFRKSFKVLYNQE